MEEAQALWRDVGEHSNEAMALMGLCEAEFGLGNLSLARDRADEALGRFRAMGYTSGMAFALIGQAYIAEHEGHDQRALQAYGDAVRLWASIGERWAIIKALAGVAGVAAAHGQQDIAATLVGVIDGRLEESGGGIFPIDRGRYDRAANAARHALGEEEFNVLRSGGRALPMAEATALALTVVIPGAQCGHRPAAGPDALSRRERDVLRLLVEGHSNAEIADTLFIAVRTARPHVASILAKFDVPTRTAAAAHARRHNLV